MRGNKKKSIAECGEQSGPSRALCAEWGFARSPVAPSFLCRECVLLKKYPVQPKSDCYLQSEQTELPTPSTYETPI